MPGRHITTVFVAAVCVLIGFFGTAATAAEKKEDYNALLVQYEDVKADRDNLVIQAGRFPEENRRLKKENERLLAACGKLTNENSALRTVVDRYERMSIRDIMIMRVRNMIEKMKRR